MYVYMRLRSCTANLIYHLSNILEVYYLKLFISHHQLIVKSNVLYEKLKTLFRDLTGHTKANFKNKVILQLISLLLLVEP